VFLENSFHFSFSSNAFLLRPRIIAEPAWYVVHTRSRHESKVELALMQKGIEIFLPRIIVPSRRRDRKLLINLPLFPGYLFVHADLVTSVYHKIIKQPGVVRLLWRNGNPSPVSNEKIESIKIIVESDRPYYPWGYLDSGKRVRIIDGPLSGAVGIIERRRDKKRRLVVAVELFQRSVAVELDEETVERWS
jgi:transcriptional antiterminator NusG